MSTTFKLYGEQIRLMTEEGKTAKEIAEIVGVGKSTVAEIVKKHKFQKALLKPTDEQWEVLIGTIIGDGCLFHSTPNSNYRMNLAHSLKQEKYFFYKYEILKPLIRTKATKRSWVDKRTKVEYHEVRFQSRVNPLFTELYKKWYKDGKKVIDYQNIKDCGALCLAIKYFDDGHLPDRKNGNPHIFMNDYDKASVENMQRWLFEKFGIQSNFHASGSIYIPASQKEKFFEIIKPYVTSDVLYKIGSPV